MLAHGGHEHVKKASLLSSLSLCKTYSWYNKERAVQQLVKLGKSSRKPLLTVLSKLPAKFKRCGLEALLKLNLSSPEGEEQIASWLFDQDLHVRSYAVKNLLLFKSLKAKSVQALLRLAKDKQAYWVRKDAIDALGWVLGVKDQRFHQLLSHSDDAVRSAAAAVFARHGLYGLKSTIPFIHDFYVRKNIDKEIFQAGEKAVPYLLKATHAKKRKTRLIAVWFLGNLKKSGEKALPRLGTLLQDPYSRVRSASIMAIRKIGAKVSTIPHLKKALQDKAAWVREAAALALADFPEKAASAIPSIIKLLYDNNRFTARATALALAKFGAKAKGALPVLLRVSKRCLPVDRWYFQSAHIQISRAVQLEKQKKRAKKPGTPVPPPTKKKSSPASKPKKGTSQPTSKPSTKPTSKKLVVRKIHSVVSLFAPSMQGKGWHQANVSFGGKIRLFAVWVKKPKGYKRGEYVEMKLVFMVLKKLKLNWDFSIRSSPNSGMFHKLIWDHTPVQGLYPTKEWKVGEVITDHFRVRIPEKYKAQVGSIDVNVGFGLGSESMKVSFVWGSNKKGLIRAKVLTIKLHSSND